MKIKVSQKLNFSDPDHAKKMREEKKEKKKESCIKDLLPTRQKLCLFCYDIILLNIYEVLDMYRLKLRIQDLGKGYGKLCYTYICMYIIWILFYNKV